LKNNVLSENWLKVRGRLGDKWWTVQKWLFSFFIAGAAFSSCWELAQKHSFKLVIYYFLFILLYWLIASLIITVGWFVLSCMNLDLQFYYRIFLRKLASNPSEMNRYVLSSFKDSNLKKIYKNLVEEKTVDQLALQMNLSSGDISESLDILYKRHIVSKRQEGIKDYYKSKSNKIKSDAFDYIDHLPRFVRRKDLNRKKFWTGWNFFIVIIFTTLTNITQKIREDDKKNKIWTLQVNLENERYGIYSNQGKDSLRNTWGGTEQNTIREETNKFYDFTKPGNKSDELWSYNGPRIPLRWASGGILPIVYCKGKYWAVLFLRDILPVGLNVANGASEEEKQLTNLDKIMEREFIEEIVLLHSCEPEAHIGEDALYVSQFGFRTTEHVDHPSLTFNSDFTKKHRELRKNFDRLTLNENPENELREIHIIKTPFRIKVNESTTEDVIYSLNLNAGEFGIEVLWVFCFELNIDRECIIDGELDLFYKRLIRRPPIMVSMDYLGQLYKEKQKSLGKPDDVDCKLLPLKLEDGTLLKNNYHVFTADIILRQKRLEVLEELKEHGKLTDKNDMWEYSKLIKPWQNTYKEALTEVLDKRFPASPDFTKDTEALKNLRTLIPVTWKTLETIFSHEDIIKYRVF